MITATCHCGAVQIEVESKPQSLTTCNCSICRRLAALWAYYTRHDARMVSSADAVSAYLWNQKIIEFYHCNTCGCVTHYESVEKNAASRFVVNARCLPASAIDGVRVRTFDGAHSFRYID